MWRNASLLLLVLAAFVVRRGLVSVMTRDLTSRTNISNSLPADMPSDVPIPPDAKCEQSSRFSGITQIELSSKQTPTSLKQFYERELPAHGWAVEPIPDFEKEEAPTEIVAEKDGRSVAAAIVPRGWGRSRVTLLIH